MLGGVGVTLKGDTVPGSVTYSSSDSRVVAVQDNGMIVGRMVGGAVVAVTAGRTISDRPLTMKVCVVVTDSARRATPGA